MTSLNFFKTSVLSRHTDSTAADICFWRSFSIMEARAGDFLRFLLEKKSYGRTLAAQYLACLFFLLSLIPETFSSSSSSSASTVAPSSSPAFHLYPSSGRASLRRRIFLGILLGSLTGFLASIVFLISIRLLFILANRTPILTGPVIFSPKISPKSLKFPSSCSGQELPLQMLGSSPNGKYFKLPLSSEATVAVKILESAGRPNSNSWKRSVQGDLELLARVSHRNVMSLRAYVRERDRFSLVYDYLPNGSLEDAMKRVRLNQLMLGWEPRHRIAVGMVKGLKHLHFESIPRILHCNLKPTNVLLDEGFEPRLGDCGLTRLVAAGADASISSGYVAPECFRSCRYMLKA